MNWGIVQRAARYGTDDIMIIGHYNFKFDVYRWAAALKKLSPDDMTAVMELSGLTVSGFWHWQNPDRSKTYIHPGMLNFLAVCNLLNLDPREFFCLDVEE